MASRLSKISERIGNFIRGSSAVDDSEFIYFWDDYDEDEFEGEVKSLSTIVKENLVIIAFSLLLVITAANLFLVLLGRDTIAFVLLLISLAIIITILIYIQINLQKPMERTQNSLKLLVENDYRRSQNILSTSGDSPLVSDLMKFQSNISDFLKEIDQANSENSVQVRKISNTFSDLNQKFEALSYSLEGSIANSANYQEIRGYLQSVSDNIDNFTNTFDLALNSIEEVTSLIKSIAKQTSMLALNAGIEAARAGDLGTGFEVVSSNLRRLSTHAVKSANEIRQETKKIDNSARLNLEDITTNLSQLQHLLSDSYSATSQVQGVLQNTLSQISGLRDQSISVENQLNTTSESFTKFNL